MLLTCLQQGNFKKSGKLTKIVKIKEENLHFFSSSLMSVNKCHRGGSNLPTPNLFRLKAKGK